MIRPNMHYAELKDSYLFFNIAQKIKAYTDAHPGVRILRMGIGDVSLPLCDAVIKALHEAVDDQAVKESFHGYMPECGAPFLRSTIADHYRSRGVQLSDDEVFVSSGASDELGDILDLFDSSGSTLVIEPAYPAYVDANVIEGRKIIHLASGRENGFVPDPSKEEAAGSAVRMDSARAAISLAAITGAVLALTIPSSADATSSATTRDALEAKTSIIE